MLHLHEVVLEVTPLHLQKRLFQSNLQYNANISGIAESTKSDQYCSKTVLLSTLPTDRNLPESTDRSFGLRALQL